MHFKAVILSEASASFAGAESKDLYSFEFATSAKTLSGNALSPRLASLDHRAPTTA